MQSPYAHKQSSGWTLRSLAARSGALLVFAAAIAGSAMAATLPLQFAAPKDDAVPVGLSVNDAYRLTFLNNDDAVRALFDWKSAAEAGTVEASRVLAGLPDPGSVGSLPAKGGRSVAVTGISLTALDPTYDTDGLMPEILRESHAQAVAVRSELDKAKAEIGGGQVAAARERLAELARSSESAEALILLAELDAKNGAPADDMVKQYMKALAADPKNALAMNNLANYLLQSNRINDAIYWGRKALKTAPGNPYVADTLGWIYFRQGNYKEARPLLELSLRAAARPVAHYHLAGLLAKTGEKERAREEYGLALKQDAKSEARSDVSSLFER